MAYQFYNPNPFGKNTIDCTIRALSKVLDAEWNDIYLDLMVSGYCLKDMPSSDDVWRSFIEDRGFKRHTLPDTCPNCYTVADFAADNPEGTFLLYVIGEPGHVVAVKDGDWYDSWDSGNRTVVFFWSKEG